MDQSANMHLLNDSNVIDNIVATNQANSAEEHDKLLTLLDTKGFQMLDSNTFCYTHANGKEIYIALDDFYHQIQFSDGTEDNQTSEDLITGLLLFNPNNE